MHKLISNHDSNRCARLVVGAPGETPASPYAHRRVTCQAGVCVLAAVVERGNLGAMRPPPHRVGGFRELRPSWHGLLPLSGKALRARPHAHVSAGARSALLNSRRRPAALLGRPCSAQCAAVAFHRARHLLTRPPPAAAAPSCRCCSCAVAPQDFQYPGAPKPTVTGVSLQVRRARVGWRDSWVLWTTLLPSQPPS
jgi:hypothetical protein